MRTIFVDKRSELRSLFKYGIKKLINLTSVKGFEEPLEALEYVEDHEVDLVVIRMNMPSMDGIELGKQMRRIHPDIMLIYILTEGENLVEALKLRAVAYLLEPCTEEDILYAIESAYLLSKRKPKRIYARPFGYFDLFLDGKPIMFKSQKAKELLALLIDRQGGVVDSEQIIATLWDGRPNDEATQSLCSKLCKTLYQELKVYGIEELLISTRSSRSINLDMLSCDLYDMLDGKEEAKRLYYGEYLTDYDWAEYRNYSLSKFV